MNTPAREKLTLPSGADRLLLHSCCAPCSGEPFIDADDDTDRWFARAKGMENEPERGICCTMCFERTVLYAHEHGFPVITSSLAFRAGRTWRRSTIAAIAPPRRTTGWCTGTATGARPAARGFGWQARRVGCRDELNAVSRQVA